MYTKEFILNEVNNIRNEIGHDEVNMNEKYKLAKKYGIEILATGDYNQTTPNGKIKIEETTRALQVSRSKYFPSTKLGVSMRTDNNQKTNNINQAQVAVDTAQT